VSTALERELDEAEEELGVSPPASVPRHPRPRLEAEAAGTAPSEWKRDNLPQAHTLPSGNIAVLRRPSLMEMLRHGEIPNPLLDVALEVAQGQPLTDYKQAAEFLSVMVANAFVEPRMTTEDEPIAEGEIAISWLDDNDRQYVMAWVQKGIAGIAPFRKDGAGPRGSGDGEDVRDAPE
jgi:hypothetical protein